MVFSLPLSELSTAIQDTISSLSGIWLTAAGLSLGGAILTYGMRLVRLGRR